MFEVVVKKHDEQMNGQTDRRMNRTALVFLLDGNSY